MLVLRSPFAAFPALARHLYPVPGVERMLTQQWPVAELMGRVDAPVLVVAGDADEIVPPAQSRDIFDAAAEPKHWRVVAGAGHKDPVFLGGPAFIDEVAAHRTPAS